MKDDDAVSHLNLERIFSTLVQWKMASSTLAISTFYTKIDLCEKMYPLFFKEVLYERLRAKSFEIVGYGR